MADSLPPNHLPNLPPGWVWFRAQLPDGRQHRFCHAAAADQAALRARAWAIWSPARAGPDGRFLAQGLSVQAVPVESDRLIPW